MSKSTALIFVAASILVLPHLSFAELEQQTRVRVVGDPKGSFTNTTGGSTFLRFVEVEVRNVGTVMAKGVTVIATLPDGERMPLSGPDEIAPNKTALYTKQIRALTTSKNNIKAAADCQNCWK